MQCRILFHDRELSRFDWCKIDEADAQSAECGVADIDQLNEIAAGCSQLLVFAPQQDILLATPQLPPRANKQQLAAIAYTLEETLAQDIDDCFFAQMPQQGDNSVPVAVIERELMDQIMALLKRLPINVRWVLAPACLCPWPQEDDYLASVCAFNNGVLIRYGQHQGLFCEVKMAPAILQQLSRNVDAGRTRVNVYGVDGLSLDNTALKLQHFAAIKLAAQPLNAAECINLKQKEYLGNKQWAGLLKRWKWPLVALILLGLVLLAQGMLGLWQQQRQLDQLVAQQQQLLKKYVPQLKPGDHPKAQLVRYLSKNRAAQGRHGFIDLLSEFTRLKTGFGQLKINKIVYQQGQLVVNLEANKLETMEALRAKLEQSRFPAQIDNVNINPDKTTGRLVMKEAQ